MPAVLAIPSKRVLAGRIAPLRSASDKITSAPSSAAEMAALRPAAEAPATRISQFTGGGGTEDEIKVSGGGARLSFQDNNRVPLHCCSIVKFSWPQIASLAAADRYRRLEARSSREAISGGVPKDAESEMRQLNV